MKKPPRPESNTSHLAGEYFVAAELYKRGYSVAITIGSAKAIDMFAEKNRRTVNVQVKAIRVRRNVGWPLTKAKVLSNVIYVFVCLNDSETAPTYFVASAREVRSRVREYGKRGIVNFGSLNSPQFLNRWDKIDTALLVSKSM